VTQVMSKKAFGSRKRRPKPKAGEAAVAAHIEEGCTAFEAMGRRCARLHGCPVVAEVSVR
jgi:hypothetical protein